MKFLSFKILLVLAYLAVVSCSTASPELIKIQGRTMGTTYSMSWVAGPAGQGVQAQVEQLLLELNRQMSTYDKGSEISRFNRAPAPANLMISDEFQQVMTQAIAIHELTDGFFDVSVGPLVNLWGFGPDGQVNRRPSDEQLRTAQNQIGLKAIELQGAKLSKQGDRYLDLSAIAKGYAVDAVAELFSVLNIQHYLIEIGGEIRAQGEKAPGKVWRIAIETPDVLQRKVHKIMAVKDQAMATSGDYRNYFEYQGKRYSHSIDPFTGHPVEHSLASVTILADNCARADALATAMLVMGADKAKSFAQEQDIKAFLIVREGDMYQEYSSPALLRWNRP